MIRVTTPDGRAQLLHPDAVASISEAGPSSQWHGIRAYIHLFNDRTLEVQETLQQVEAQIATAKAGQ